MMSHGHCHRQQSIRESKEPCYNNDFAHRQSAKEAVLLYPQIAGEIAVMATGSASIDRATAERLILPNSEASTFCLS